MMLDKRPKAMVCLLAGDIDFFVINTEVLQGETLSSFPFIIFLDDILRTSVDLMKENGLILK